MSEQEKTITECVRMEQGGIPVPWSTLDLPPATTPSDDARETVGRALTALLVKLGYEASRGSGRAQVTVTIHRGHTDLTISDSDMLALVGMSWGSGK